MGQHFLFHRELVAATAVHHAVHARLTNDAQRDLVLVGPQWLRVYRVEPFGAADAAKGQVLHLVAAFQLAGVAESVRVLHFDRGVLRKKRRAFLGGQDVLLLSFARFKWVIVGYDRRTRALVTLAMFSFAEDAIGPGATLKADKNGREQLLGIATESVVRVDPQTRCGAMLVYTDQLVIVPFRSESMELSFFEEDEDEDDDEEEEDDQLDGSKTRSGRKDGAAPDDGDDDDDDDDEEKKLEELVKESKQRGNDAVSNKLMTLLDKSVKVGAKRKRNDMSGLMPNEIAGREFLLRLRELEICGKIVDMAFLDGYLEPTLMILHEENDKISTAGRLATGYDTYCLTVISINLNTRMHPKIWSVRNLPSDSFRLIPCRAPLGGVVVLAANAILYFNQTQFYGIATNIFATKTVNQSVYPLEDAVYESPDQQVNRLNVVLNDCEYTYLGQKEILLALPTGELFALGLPYDDTATRSYGLGSNATKVGLSLKLIRSGVSMNCMAIDEERKTLFIGSRSGDSVLFAFEEAKSAADAENGAVKSDGGNTVANKEDTQPAVNASVQDEKEDAVKPEVEDVEEDEDDLFLYGSAATSSSTNGASTASAPGVDDSASNGVKVETPVVSEGQVHEAPELNSYNYSLSPIDRLTGVGQITSLELGIETNVDSNEKREQLVASGGYLQDGAISVLHHGLRPIVGTEAELNGCRAMWTVSSSLDDARKSDDGRIYNSYLILSIGQRTMVLRTGEGMDPLEDNSGFYTSGPTLAAANLFGKQRIVQVFKQGARVMMEVPVEEGEKKEEKPTKSEDLEGAAANGEDEDDEDEEDDGPQVKLICTQEITLEGDVESGGMNVDTSSVGIVSVDVIDPFILLLLTDGTVRLLMGDDDMELTVIDPEREIYSSSSSSSNDNAPSRGISAACLFYDWAGMFQDNAWGEDEREERNDVSEKHDSDQKPDQTNRKGGSNDVDEDMDDLYSSKPSPRFKAHHAAPSSGFKSPASGISAAIGPDSSVSVALLARSAASMMCALCFEDGSLHVFSLPDFKKKGIFPYLTFAPQRLVNTMEHYQANRKKTVRFAAPVLGLNASSASANEGRIKKSHTINSPVADITIHRVGPAEGQHNAQYFARMVLLVFLANGDLLMYAATPKMGNPRGNGAAPSVVSFQFVRIGSDLITRPFLPPKAKAGTTHNETGNNPEANTSAVLAKLRAGFRYSMLTRFNNINNMSGAFFRGAHPMWILSERGFPTFVPMCVPPVASPTPANGNAGNSTPRLSVPVLSFTPFHHWNCPNGFIYFHSRGALRVCELPSSRTSTILPLSRGFVLHKAELGVTIHKLLFLGNRGPGGVSEALETPTYALVCSRRLPMAEAERATEHENPEDDMEEEVAEGEDGGAKSNVMAPTAEMFPDIALEDLPMSEEDVYELRLVQTNEFGEWNARTGVFRVHFERYEVVLSVQLMYLYDSALMREDISSRSSEWARKKRPYLVVGTGYVGPHGEDESGRGRLLLYELDYAQYVNNDGSGATSSKLPKLRLVFIKEHRQGAISSVTQLGPYVLAAVGSKLIVYEFKSEQLIGCAFYDAQTFIVSLSVVRGDFVVYADVYKSAHFLRWREMQRQLVLLAKDYEPLAVTATEFSVFERKLALLATDMEENLHVMQFAPHDVESRGGQRLLRTADFHLGVQVIAMLRKRVDVAPTANVCYVNLLGSSEGSLAALVPVPERVFRRLFTLQNVMINTLPQNCALNPRDFRALKSNSYRHAGRPDAWTKHKWKKSFLDALVLFRFLHLDYVAQKELARCIGTTPEVVTHNLLEVQRATAAFL